MFNCPVGWAIGGEGPPLNAATALSMSDRCAVSSPTGGRLTAELSISGFAGLCSSLKHAAGNMLTCVHPQHHVRCYACTQTMCTEQVESTAKQCCLHGLAWPGILI